MKLRRLRVEQFCQFRQPLEIRGLEPGLNLFTGPNESGKTTLVRAIRAAFFERYRSSSVEDLQPWGDSAAAPSVELEFEWQGECWHLAKRFIRQKRCDLRKGDQSFDGEEAEDMLACLLGYQFAGRGASKGEHWGIPGLLWIEQGTGQDIHTAVTHAGDHLKSALGQTLGEVASSAGDGMTALVQRERAILLTPGGKPTGDYARILQEHGQYQAKLEEIDTRIATYRQQVDRLGELQHLQRDDTARPWEHYRQQVRQTQVRLAEVEKWELEQQREQRELHHCQQSQQWCNDQFQQFARQQQERQQRDMARQQAAAAQEEVQARQPQVQTVLCRAQAAYQQAREALAQARQQEQHNTLVRELVLLREELATTESAWQQAQELQSRLLAQRTQLQALHIDTRQLGQLQKLSQECSDLEIQRKAVATRLQFALEPSQRLQLGDEVLEGQGERLLLEPVSLSIEGMGVLHIQPGGEDVADLARRQQTRQDRFAAMLEKMGVSDLTQAQERAQQCRSLQEEIRHNELRLYQCASKGVAELEQGLQLQRQRLHLLEQQQTHASPVAIDCIGVAHAEAQSEAAREKLKAAEQAEADFRRDFSLAEQAWRNADAEWQRVECELQSTERQQREQQLHAQRLELQGMESALRASISHRQQEIDTANPELLRQDIERLSRTADGMEKAAQERAQECDRLQTSLEALGAQGLEEQRTSLLLEQQRVERRRDELSRRAAALNALLQLLQAKRQELVQRLQQPLQCHLDRYLQLIFPQASLRVDENLIPEQLVRTSHHREARDSFAMLSFGAREQMGLISRLAYADLLQEANRPTLIILDDALVHSDRQRLEPMKRILFDAARRHQILLFTCHPDKWRDLGVTAREMQLLRAGA